MFDIITESYTTSGVNAIFLITIGAGGKEESSNSSSTGRAEED